MIIIIYMDIGPMHDWVFGLNSHACPLSNFYILGEYFVMKNTMVFLAHKKNKEGKKVNRRTKTLSILLFNKRKVKTQQRKIAVYFPSVNFIFIIFQYKDSIIMISMRISILILFLIYFLLRNSDVYFSIKFDSK